MTSLTEERRIGWLLTFGWAAVAAAIAVSAAAAVREGLVPYGDSAVIASLVMDSTTSDPPLVGAPTSLGYFDGGGLHHLGPLGLWSLAVPTRLWGAPGAGLVIAAAALSVASLAGVALLARRLRQPAAEGLLLVLVAGVVATIGGARFSDPLNPFVGLMPLLLFVIASWGVVAGHPRQLWFAVPAGSLASQSHLGYVPLVAMVLLVVIAALVLQARSPAGSDRRWLTRWVMPIGVGLGVLCWVGPILDQIGGSQNLSRLIRYQTSNPRPTLGWHHGLRMLVEMTALPPGWLLGRAADSPVEDPGLLRAVSSAVSLLGVVLVTARAHRSRDRVLSALGILALVSVAAATLSSARVNRDLLSESLLFYRLFWWPTGLLVALTLLFGGVRLLPGILRRPTSPERSASHGRGAVAMLSAVAVAVAVGLAGLGYVSPDRQLVDAFRPSVAHARAVADIPADVVVLTFELPGEDLAAGDPSGFFGQALLAQLRLRGIEVRLPPVGSAEANSPLAVYRDEHPAEGDEDAVILFRAGAGVLGEAPEGFRRISEDPGSSSGTNPLLVPSAVYVREGTAAA